MIEPLIHFLGTELELNAEEVADLLWLTLEQQKKRISIEEEEPSLSEAEIATIEALLTLIFTFCLLIENNLAKLALQLLPPSRSLTTPIPPFPVPPKPPQPSKVGIYTRSPSQTPTSTPEGYTPLPVPDARALNHPLNLLKALKPLLRRVPSLTEEIINETATADWIAQTQLWQVITEPDSELWLDLVLVVDESVSMILWRRTVEELQQFLKHYGIFRDVRVWGMGLDSDQNLYFRSAIRSHQPKELIDIQGRRLILLVSDFVDNLWYQEPILQILEQWSNSNPVAALQMLPEWLWSRSALAVHTPATLYNTNQHIINRNLEALVNPLPKMRGLDRGIRLPVFSLERDLLTLEIEQTKRWSRMLAGIGEKGALGYVLRPDLLEHKRTTTSQGTAPERVSNFSGNASPLAHQLAGLLAAAPVITMPVVRLIRDSMLPESGQIEIAEVFLGGLLKPLTQITPETDPELVHYDFMEGVRAELLKTVPVPERDEVLDRVSRHVAKGLGKSLREFIAWIQNPSVAEGTKVESVVKPFARITREILGQLNEIESTEVISSVIDGFTVRTEEIEIVTVKVLRGGEEKLFKQLRSKVAQSVISNSQLYQRMLEQIALLPEEYRIPLELKYLEGVSDREIVLRMKIYREELDRRIDSAINLLISQLLVEQDLLLLESETVFVDQTGTIIERKPVQAYYYSVDIYDSTNDWIIAAPNTTIKAITQTNLKKQSIQASELSVDQKVEVPVDKEYKVLKYSKTSDGHYQIELDHGAGIWYIWSAHWHLPWENVLSTVQQREQIASPRQASSPASQEDSEYLENKLNLDMLYIPGGTFMMGTEDEEIERLVKKFNWEYFRYEKPQHQVRVSPFYMSKYPITQGQWKAIALRSDLQVNKDIEFPLEPSSFDKNPQSFSFPNTRGSLDLPPYGDNPTRWHRPVEQVNWYQAKEFCARLSKLTGQEYRLPTEAEWEYACKADPPLAPPSKGGEQEAPLNKGGLGGSDQPFHFGETITSDFANYNATYTYADEPEGVYREETTPVGMFPPNAFGLYDMHGNVLEWCEDDWHDNYEGAPTNGSAWIDESSQSNTFVVRGGSWYILPDDCRSADRYDYDGRDVSINVVGFRVVCVVGRDS